MVPLLPETGRRVNEIVTSAQATGRVPSLVLGVVRDRALLHFTGAGEQPRPDPKTQYRIGSITKTMTAVMIMQLRDEGFFSLDDLLYRHLPGTTLGGVTLRQLLGHVSGLQREPDGEWWERATGSDVDTFLADLAFDKLAGPPFRSYHYSNLAYGLLGAVLRRVTGEAWTDLVSKRVLDPLGMKRTTYAPVEPFARGYVDEMCTPVVMSDLDAWTSGHGLGPELYRVGERIFVGHGGSMPGYVAQLVVHRRTRTAVVAFANAYGLRTTTIRQVALDALNVVLDAEPVTPEPWRPAPAPDAGALELCGRWWWMGREYEVTAHGPDVIVSCLTAPSTPWWFVREAPDRWRGRSGMNDGEILAVRRDTDGTVTALDIATFVFRRDLDLA